MKYMIVVSPAAVEELEMGLGKMDLKLLSYHGVWKKTNTQFRYLPPNYGGIGLNSLSYEATSTSLNVFLCHYRTDTLPGHLLTTSIEYLYQNY